MRKQYLQTGKIVGTHGVRGMVRVQPWCDSPDFLCGLSTLYLSDEGQTPLRVVSARPHGNLALLAFEGVGSIEAAERLRGRVLYLNRDDLHLAPGRYLIDDLLGCAVADADTGETLGRLCEVSSTGANDVWHIVRDGKTYLVPAIEEVIVSVDPDAEQIAIRPLKGIFDDAD